MKDLVRMAARAGLEIHAVEMPAGDLGYYAPEEFRIYFNLACTPAERRSVVAHELGHHWHAHDCDSERAERQADTYAATLLVDPARYAQLERFNPDVEWIADELGVTVEVIEDYRRYCLQRVGDVTYTRPRMGVGQWLYRAAAL